MMTLLIGRVHLSLEEEIAILKTKDAHDWGIRHDGYPFDSLWTRIPRFMSEYGFQSLPEDYTISTILSHDSILRDINFRTHPEVIAHEKHSRGFDIIDSYISFTHSNFALDSPLLRSGDT